MLKKKSTIFALIGVLCLAAAMYFIYRETRANYDLGDFDETEPDDDAETVTPAKTVNTTAEDESTTEPES